MPASRPGLLVLPGWDDDGKAQFDRLHDELGASGWACRRAYLPDAAWPPAQREAFTREDAMQQGARDVDALRQEADPQRLGLLGFSFGAYIAAQLTQARSIEWLVLRAPALYPDDDWTTPKADLDKRELDDYRRRVHESSTNLALDACAAFRGDVLLVQCESDEVIPPPVYESYERALQGARSFDKHVLRGADHELSEEASRIEYHRVVVDWLKQRA